MILVGVVWPLHGKCRSSFSRQERGAFVLIPTYTRTWTLYGGGESETDVHLSWWIWAEPLKLRFRIDAQPALPRTRGMCPSTHLWRVYTRPSLVQACSTSEERGAPVKDHHLDSPSPRRKTLLGKRCHVVMALSNRSNLHIRILVLKVAAVDGICYRVN